GVSRGSGPSVFPESRGSSAKCGRRRPPSARTTATAAPATAAVAAAASAPGVCTATSVCGSASPALFPEAWVVAASNQPASGHVVGFSEQRVCAPRESGANPRYRRRHFLKSSWAVWCAFLVCCLVRDGRTFRKHSGRWRGGRCRCGLL
ncbi:NOT2 / NOT3 / NOT5 family protein, partial [Toxoplasma gondii FOU]